LHDQNLVTNTNVKHDALLTTTVETNQVIELGYEEDFHPEQCLLLFKFQANASQTYKIFVGDIAGRTACTAKVWQIQANGNLIEIPLQRAFY
jgi:hypothetical protein